MQRQQFAPNKVNGFWPAPGQADSKDEKPPDYLRRLYVENDLIL
jgi:hypothetical protein